MAFYFSRRKLKPREEEEMGELNIVPYLDILMNLIIFMLLSMTGLAAPNSRSQPSAGSVFSSTPPVPTISSDDFPATVASAVSNPCTELALVS